MILLVIVTAALWGRTLYIPLSHDEHQFVAAGELIRAGLVPYRDFPFHHVPNLGFVYATVFQISDRLFFSARAVSFLAASVSATLIFLLVRKFAVGTARPDIPAAIGLLAFVGSPLTAYTSGRAWNHDLAVALALGALVVVVADGRTRIPNGAASGLLVGLAIGTRASFLLLALVTTGWLLLQLVAGRGDYRAALAHIVGMGMGLLSTLVSAAVAPRYFLFDNWTYTRLNTAYREALGHEAAMSLKGKAVYLTQIAADPIHTLLILAAVAGGTVLLINRRGRKGQRQVGWPLFLCAGFAVLAGSLIPTPSWPQYFYDPYPFLVIGVAILAVQAQVMAPRIQWLYGPLALVILFLGTEALLDAFRPVFDGDQNTIDQVESMAEEIASYSGVERVVTLAPTIPLEAGFSVLPEFASGPFTWRVAPLYSREARIDEHLLHPEELSTYRLDPGTTAVLTGFEAGNDGFVRNEKGGLEQPLVLLAEMIDLQRIRLHTGFEHPINFWVPGSQNE